MRRYSLRTALFAGDDVTDLDGFDAVDVRVGVRSDEGPPEIVERADLVVDDMADVLAALA
jgi:trehalose-6-phosphatase